MRFCSTSPALLAFLLLLSNFTFALPASDTKPSDEPLPGRSDTSIDENGVVTGHYGDDFLFRHMNHVQDNQRGFPQNKEPFDTNPDATSGRIQKIGGSHLRAGTDPVTKEPRVKDEKPLASQKILPRRESGFAPMTDLRRRRMPDANACGKQIRPMPVYRMTRNPRSWSMGV